MMQMVPNPVRSLAALAAALVLAALVPLPAHAQAAACASGGSLAPLPGLPEASGLALSRHAPSRLWTHNDSGEPVLFALDAAGAVAGQVRISGADVEDWEAIAAGACGSGSCIYIADIGDNDGERAEITVYRVPEPQQPGGTATVSGVFRGRYPDRAQDAETLLVAGGRLYIVTKGSKDAVSLYRFPAELREGATVPLERVGQLLPKAATPQRITDGDVSPDGRWIALRSRSAVTIHIAADLLAGRWRPVSTVDVTGLKEPQGEGIAFGADGTVYLAGEGAKKGNAGTFARLSCRLPAG
jgi:hypothetical protein